MSFLTKERRERWERNHRDAGLCGNCNEKAEPDKAFCRIHLNRALVATKKRHAKKAAEGKCLVCGSRQARPMRTRCAPCSDRSYQARKRVVADYIVKGLCGACGGSTPQELSHLKFKMCWKHYFQHRARAALGSAKHGGAIKELIEQQGYVCPYTGKVLTLAKDAALDHKEPLLRKNQGNLATSGAKHPERCVVSNVQWIHEDANFMKSGFTENKFLSLVKAIYEYRHLDNWKDPEQDPDR